MSYMFVFVMNRHPLSSSRPDPLFPSTPLFRYLLVEGGGELAAGLLSEDLVDRIHWFRAAMLIGNEGRPVIGRLPLDSLAAAPRFRRVAAEPLGEDRSEEHTSELQSLMRISYAVFCLKKKKNRNEIKCTEI